ncbi:GFA family protein [Cupriavidus sp. AcVe19-1a]|uniref:GFA family protein n=1 Tax=Cupriavidus sp. AcVe19-1a TaxID=2821359 RepID=UPI001AE41AEF|nr:GFA family protein [Cupriavidus sp. AcVe19-1a]MBP0632901.1 GFA family protein [Cupriavidus sp. AcVe19-1a]
MQERQGGCLCGAVRYIIKGEPQATAVCHCRHCQRQSGSLFSFNLFVNEADYAQRGQTSIYEDRGDSGHPSYRHFCVRCGSPILTRVSMLPGVVLVKAGTLDGIESVQPPQTEIYTDRAVPWLAPVEGASRFPLSP